MTTSRTITINRSGEAQGDTLYFAGSAWVHLPPGAVGRTLVTGGAGANPSWEEFAGDITGTSQATVVGAISGASPIPITPSSLRWLSATTTPTITQATTGGSVGATMLFRAQDAGTIGGKFRVSSGSGGSIPGSVEICTADTIRMVFESSNAAFFSNTGSYGGGVGVIFVANVTTPPASTPIGGGVEYVEGGAKKYKGTNGTVFILGSA